MIDFTGGLLLCKLIQKALGMIGRDAIEEQRSAESEKSVIPVPEFLE